jgi:hypothetical protein
MTEALYTQPESEDDMPGGPMVGSQLDPRIETALAALQEELVAEGESEYDRDPFWMRRQFGDERILDGLQGVEAVTGVPVKEFVRHSHRWSELDTSLVLNGQAIIPSSHLNLRQSGVERREERGAIIDLDLVRAQGVDPSRVLYYRATQPATTTPKPEYFWTSDSLEVRTGLRRELGSQENQAIVLVSTLEMIAQNGGLMLDINDDTGVAVRQIGLEPFSQNNTLFKFARVPGTDLESLLDASTSMDTTAVEPVSVEQPTTLPPLDDDEDVW